MRIATLCVQLFLLSSVIATPNVGKERTILEVLDDDYRFARLMDALNKERTLTEELIDRPKAEMTVFAPTNEAFRKLRDRFRGRYPKDLLKEMIQYHVIYKVTSSETLDETKLFQTSLQLKELDDRMQSVRITRYNGRPLLNGHARLQETDMGAINGMIHAIDEVLIPPPEINKVLLRTPSLFSTMSAALQRTGLDKKVQESTGMSAFIPTNQAFRNLGCRALNYLFSRDGEKDLRKLVEYHFSNKLSYSMDMLNEVTGGGGRNKHGRRRGNNGRRRDDDWVKKSGMVTLSLDQSGEHIESECYDQRDLYTRHPNHGRRGGWDDDDDYYDRPHRGGYRRGRGGWDDDDDDDDYDQPRRGGNRRGRGGWDDNDDDYDQPRRGGNRRGRGGWDDDDDYNDQPRRGRGGWDDDDYDDQPRRGGHRGRGGWDDDDDDYDQPRRGGHRRGRGGWDDDDDDYDQPRRGGHRHGRGDRDNDRGRRGRGGRHGQDEFEKIKFPSMFGGEKLEVYLNSNSLRGNHFDIVVNNEARVIFADYVAKNGVIHGLDNILVPEGLDIPSDWFDDEPCDF